MLNIEPPGPANSGSIAETLNNQIYMLGMVHVVNLVW
jgi:hypothetical protein